MPAEAAQTGEPGYAGPLVVSYTNYRGETATRRIIPLGAPYWGSNEWHKESQWLMRALDLDKGEEREFAMKDMTPNSNPCGVSERLGRWLSAALDDPDVCAEMKADIEAWFAGGSPPAEINQDALRAALKPCPFCGKAPTMIPDGSGNHYVRCISCYIARDYGSEKQATESWNRRAAIPQEGAAARKIVLAEREENEQALQSLRPDGNPVTWTQYQKAADHALSTAILAIRKRPLPCP